MSVANYITFIRLFISPIFFILYREYDALGISFNVLPYILIFLLGVSEASDAFDGYFARKYNEVTDLGKILDPMADSVYRISVFLTFTDGIVQLPMALVFVFLYRDSVLSTLRTICALRGFALAARTSGKIKAIIQACASFGILGLMILYNWTWISISQLQTYSLILVAIAAVYAALSGVEYLYANRIHVKKILTAKRKANV